jgi:hypothetical protein
MEASYRNVSCPGKSVTNNLGSHKGHTVRQARFNPTATAAGHAIWRELSRQFYLSSFRRTFAAVPRIGPCSNAPLSCRVTTKSFSAAMITASRRTSLCDRPEFICRHAPSGAASYANSRFDRSDGTYRFSIRSRVRALIASYKPRSAEHQRHWLLTPFRSYGGARRVAPESSLEVASQGPSA